jgi:ATP-binding cassette subfamily C protein
VNALRFGLAALPRRPLLALAAWSVPEALPSALLGVAVARAVDSGFLAGRPVVGLAWLGVLLLAAGVGAIGARQVFRRLGDVVEPFRDELVRRVVGGALRRAVAGQPDDGAVVRLTRQVEIVRDTYAGLIVVVRGFVVTVVGAAVGLMSVAPVIGLLILPPFVLGVAAFVATLGFAAERQRAAVRTDERLSATAGAVLAGVRDVVARGAEEHAAAMVAGPIREQAAAERALAGTAALRTLCFAVGGWLPLVVVLAAGPWLVRRGLTAGAIMGALTYVLFALQPALSRLMSGLGGSGLRFVVTLDRILTASTVVTASAPRPVAARGYDVVLRGVTFRYGPHAEPVLRDLDLILPEGDHLAIVGPSGIGKSTMASLVCGLLSPASGSILVGGAPAGVMPGTRVLIPQEAYVFAGTVRENLLYLRPGASTVEVEAAVEAVGASTLVDRLGGMEAPVRPDELSAGERQLIALARAYLSPALLVVLDEATCHLDPAAERVAEEAFAAREGTLIVIAHRVTSAERARRILVLDGVSPDLGTHAALLSRNPLYRELHGLWHPGLIAGASPTPARPSPPVKPSALPGLPALRRAWPSDPADQGQPHAV